MLREIPFNSSFDLHPGDSLKEWMALNRWRLKSISQGRVNGLVSGCKKIDLGRVG